MNSHIAVRNTLPAPYFQDDAVCDRLTLWIFNVAESWGVMPCGGGGQDFVVRMSRFASLGRGEGSSRPLSMSKKGHAWPKHIMLGRETP